MSFGNSALGIAAAGKTQPNTIIWAIPTSFIVNPLITYTPTGRRGSKPRQRWEGVVPLHQRGGEVPNLASGGRVFVPLHQRGGEVPNLASGGRVFVPDEM
jgi:hypothetical protein